MNFNIDEERTKLIKVINDDEFNFLEFVNQYLTYIYHAKMNFLWQVLTLTAKYPQVEIYFKNILNYFTIDELEIFFGNWTILHYMCKHSCVVSLNTFEIVINYGININIKSKLDNTLAHILLYDVCDNHKNNILNLFIKYGINLNIVNHNGDTILDTLSRKQTQLSEEIKKCIATIIDFGGITNRLIKNNVVYDFIEYYKWSSVKPAIKNENNI